MGYDFKLTDAYRVKERKVYPWPCQPIPDRTVELFTDDVLTISGPGTVTKHTGLCMLNIRVPMADLEPIGDVNLRLL